MDPIVLQIAAELEVRPPQVRAAVELLDGGATVPFIARYRKEATAGLDDSQLRTLQTRLAGLRELDARRATVLASIRAQGKLSAELERAIAATPTRQALEDLYLPYKPKRRTKAMIAREAGLEPLADSLVADPRLDPAAEAARYLAPDAGFADVRAVQDGVRDLLAERWAEDAALVAALREWLWAEGMLRSRLASGCEPTHPEAAKFRDYFDHLEPIANVPSHRALAMLRGRAQQWLDVALLAPDAAEAERGAAAGAAAATAGTQRLRAGDAGMSLAELRIARHLGWHDAGRAGDPLLRRTIAWTWKVKLSLALERDLFARLRDLAEEVAIRVFADNLRDVLLAAPAGPRVVMGLDPGVRTGVKVAVVDATGKVLETATVYPHEPRRDREGALQTLARLVAAHGVRLVAIGNGTASRETDALAAELGERLRRTQPGLALERIVISEAGASVYSASEYASRELPELDVSLRGAVSIARRVQDPLAELVKIEPKSIGVGQYQHDVDPSRLARTLDAVVEDCVNAVGVDLNTASVPLLARVAGLNAGVAAGIVRRRETAGAFTARAELLDVTGLGAKTFEQAAGFLRIRGGANPLDATGVHPESYALVERIGAAFGCVPAELIGRADVLRSLRPEAFADERTGIVTVRDILAELEKPGRDPRPDFRVARFDEGVRELKDLAAGMVLEGTVTNVAQFGAFVDIGVHQDGLVHLSQLSERFVRDAREVVRTGQTVQVRVLEVDHARRRIALSMKPAGAAGATPGEPRSHPAGRDERRRRAPAAVEGAMAAAFAKLQRPT